VLEALERRPVALQQRLLLGEHLEHRLPPAGDVRVGPRILSVRRAQKDHPLFLDVADLPLVADHLTDDELQGCDGVAVGAYADSGHRHARVVVRCWISGRRPSERRWDDPQSAPSVMMIVTVRTGTHVGVSR